MSRHLRQKTNTHIYHVVIKGADRQLLFENSKDYEKYLDFLAYYKEECRFNIFAYCLMSNHVHLLIRHSEAYSLESIFRRLNTSYALWFNMKYDRTGFVQNDRFYSEPVEDEQYLHTVVRYIHFNPAKAGLEQAPGQSYPWSSFYEYLNTDNINSTSSIQSLKIVDTEFYLNIIGGIDQFQSFHSLPTDNIMTDKCLDIEHFRTRLPDDVARDIIQELSDCSTVSEFQKLPLTERDKFLKSIHEKGVSIRQLNRLTGTPRGVIVRSLNKS